jgi:pimeloyl-ACP methyl ester carboxylesterase
MAESSTRVGDIKMSYRVFGTGDPLLMIMGYGSTMSLWEPGLIGQLAARFKVIIFDNRGMGNTETGSREFSIEQFADDTSGLMEALGIRQAHVMGWSMGSLIAQEMTLRHPAKVDRLVLCAAQCDAGMFPPAPEVIEQLTDMSGTPQERGMRYIGVLFSGSWLQSHGERIKEIFFRPMGNIPEETMVRQAMAIDAWKGTSDRLGGILNPTLLITGKEDLLVVPRNARYLSENIPNAQLILIENAGHGLMFQYPDTFCEKVLEFLE